MSLYASGAGVFTPEGFAAALERWGDAIRPAILKGAKRGARIARSIAVSKFRTAGVGRVIFGRGLGKSNRGLIRATAAQKGDVVVIQVELRGFAALQEKGGRTKAHDILPKHRQALKLSVPSLGVVIRRAVHHPGSNIKRIPFATEALLAAAPRISDEIENAIVLADTGIGVRRSRVVKGAA